VGAVEADEERIALFLDYENLAIGARDALGGMTFDLKPVMDALAERGRVIARKAYADWSSFDEDRRMLTRWQVELVEIPQRMGAVRKNAGDIKMAVDAMEVAFERPYVTTFAICTGDSDLTPLVHKLRELDKRVVGVGIKESTSALLPPACDEFLFYETLEGVDLPVGGARKRSGSRRGSGSSKRQAAEPVATEETATPTPSVDEIAVQVAQTVSGLERSSGGTVLASTVKRALLRKDPTFSEAEYGFRGFGEFLRHLADRNVIDLSDGPARGDPLVSLPSQGGETEAFDILRRVVGELTTDGETAYLSGLKNAVRKTQPGFSEKKFGYGGFLQFVKAAATKGVVSLAWDPDDEDYVLGVPSR
jgi:hypothetical protein